MRRFHSTTTPRKPRSVSLRCCARMHSLSATTSPEKTTRCCCRSSPPASCTESTRRRISRTCSCACRRILRRTLTSCSRRTGALFTSAHFPTLPDVTLLRWCTQPAATGRLRRVEHGSIQFQVEKPAEHQVVRELLAKLLLAPDR